MTTPQDPGNMMIDQLLRELEGLYKMSETIHESNLPLKNG